MSDLTVIIPSRNEIYLQKTIDDILLKSRGDTEIVVVLDGYWPDPPLKDDKRLRIIHRGVSRGMRDAINSAVGISTSEFILKCDAHCMFDEGFDLKLMADCDDDWISVPVRKRLLPEEWKLEEVDGRPDVIYMYLAYPYDKEGNSRGLHGRNWNTLNIRRDLDSVKIDDLMTCQGSCYFMHRNYFHTLELMDIQIYGNFWDEFLEVGMKCWLSGGRIIVNKNTWYAHWHKNNRGYNLPNEVSHSMIWMEQNAWSKQTLPLSYLIGRFSKKFGDLGWPKELYEAD